MAAVTRQVNIMFVGQLGAVELGAVVLARLAYGRAHSITQSLIM
jgi:hypothetical protein